MAKCLFDDPTKEMPADGETEIDTPVRTRQMTKSPAGALAPMNVATDGLDVVHVKRPRRGHDY